MNKAWRVWIQGFIATYINSSASYLVGMQLDPAQQKLVLKLAILHGLMAVAAYLKQSPIPGGTDAKGE